MKIIVISDTHGSYRNFQRVMQLHRNADIVVHCGDSRDELDEIRLESYGRFHCRGSAFLRDPRTYVQRQIRLG